MGSESLDEEQQHQEDQYEYPYHYIPEKTDDSFTQTQQWSWGFRYLGGLKVVLDQLEGISFGSLLDVGCGDGRFLREIKTEYPDIDALGIDYSERPINLANAMNPGIEYRCHDILEDDITETFDVVTLIEVLEHIPPDDINTFLDAIAETLTPDGTLILTVPHTNKPVQEKHYQHFNRAHLQDLLNTRFESLSFVPFDTVGSKVLRAVELLLGGNGNHFVVTNDRIMSAFWDLYKNKYLYTSEDRCGRLAIICRNPCL